MDTGIKLPINGVKRNRSFFFFFLLFPLPKLPNQSCTAVTIMTIIIVVNHPFLNITIIGLYLPPAATLFIRFTNVVEVFEQTKTYSRL